MKDDTHMNILHESILEHMKDHGYYNTNSVNMAGHDVSFRCCKTKDGKILANETVQKNDTSLQIFGEYSAVTGKRDGNYTEVTAQNKKKYTENVLDNTGPVLVYRDGVLTDTVGNSMFANQAMLEIGAARRENRHGNGKTIFTEGPVSLEEYQKATMRTFGKHNIIN